MAFASRCLTPTEQKYTVGEREALACVWPCERWHMYLYGCHFTLRTDHQALTAPLTTTRSGHKPLQLYRWSERLQAYNQILKIGLRADLADGLSFTAALENTLLHYRATTHATTNTSPAFLMLGRELQLPLDRLRPHREDTLTAKPSPRDTVAGNQQCMKRCYDRVRRVRQPALEVSDWVRIRRPNRSHKLLSFWSSPQQTTAQLGTATFRLADGSRWHASRLRRVTPPLAQDQAAAADSRHADWDWGLAALQTDNPVGHPPEVEAQDTGPELGPRPVQVRQRPSYLNNYSPSRGTIIHRAMRVNW
nr:uncharacterized protein LOC125984055 [Syngnathus scovelli]